MGITSRNWPWALLLMAVLGAQSHVLVRSYEVLIKDREIIAAEVMAEYDQSVSRTEQVVSQAWLIIVTGASPDCEERRINYDE